jgi:hypothetical protein
MEQILTKKAEQLPAFRDALINSGESRLVHSTYPKDVFWGSGLFFYDHKGAEMKDLPGQNVFGMLLMEVRQKLLDVVSHKNGEKAISYAAVAAGAGKRADTASKSSCFSQQGRRQRTKKDSTNNPHRCFHCGVPGHVFEDCRLKGVPVQCFGCNQYGHKRTAICSVACRFSRSWTLAEGANKWGLLGKTLTFMERRLTL